MLNSEHYRENIKQSQSILRFQRPRRRSSQPQGDQYGVQRSVQPGRRRGPHALTPVTPWADTSSRKPAISQRFKNSSVTPTQPSRLSTPGSLTKSWLTHWMIGDLLLNSLYWPYSQAIFFCRQFENPVNLSGS